MSNFARHRNNANTTLIGCPIERAWHKDLLQFGVYAD